MSNYTKIATSILTLLAVHQLLTGFIHAYTEKNMIQKNHISPAVLWSLSAFGNRQLYVGVWELMVAFDWGGIRKCCLRPVLGLHASTALLYQVSPLIHGRFLSEIAPESAGNSLPAILLVLCAVGYVFTVVDQDTTPPAGAEAVVFSSEMPSKQL